MPIQLVDDAINTPQGTPVNIDVLANDQGVQDVPIMLSIVDQTPDGEAVVEPDNTITFTPRPDYNGITSFAYQVVDNSGNSHVARVYVYVVPDMPQISLRHGSTKVLTERSVVDFGSTSPGTPLRKTFVLTNLANTELYVHPVVVPPGYEVLSDFLPKQVVAPGAQAIFTVQLDASSPGPFTGDVSFYNSSETQNPFRFTVTGIVEEEPARRFRELIRENSNLAEQQDHLLQQMTFFTSAHAQLKQELDACQGNLVQTAAALQAREQELVDLQKANMELQARVDRLSEQVTTDEIVRLTPEEVALLFDRTLQAFDQIASYQVRNLEVTLKAGTGKVGELGLVVIPPPGSVDPTTLHEFKFTLRSSEPSKCVPATSSPNLPRSGSAD